jgi:hypothetical protein
MLIIDNIPPEAEEDDFIKEFQHEELVSEYLVINLATRVAYCCFVTQEARDLFKNYQGRLGTSRNPELYKEQDIRDLYYRCTFKVNAIKSTEKPNLEDIKTCFNNATNSFKIQPNLRLDITNEITGIKIKFNENMNTWFATIYMSKKAWLQVNDSTIIYNQQLWLNQKPYMALIKHLSTTSDPAFVYLKVTGLDTVNPFGHLELFQTIQKAGYHPAACAVKRNIKTNKSKGYGFVYLQSEQESIKITKNPIPYTSGGRNLKLSFEQVENQLKNK